MPGFDISGHCFMLIYANLIMSEEVSDSFHFTFSESRKLENY